MNPETIGTGWWTIVGNRFVNCYDTKEEALRHIEYQRKTFGSKETWYIMYIKVTFGESTKYPYNE